MKQKKFDWELVELAEIFTSTGEWGVQMSTLTGENSQFLWSGTQEVSLVCMREKHGAHFDRGGL